MKKLIKRFIFEVFNKKNVQKTTVSQEIILWNGNFSSWSQATEKSSGYDSQIILNKCLSALLKVKNGIVPYERDSVLFEKIEYSWPLLAGLQKAALDNNNELNILDYGGSLGSSFYQNRLFLSNLKTINWNIVEQRHFVECGKQHFANEQLHFFEDIGSCMAVKKPNVLLVSSVLQYLEKPFELLEKVQTYNFNYIIIDRTSFINDESRITVQHVPESIYVASYPCWFFNETHLLNIFSKKYDLIADFQSFADPNCLSEDKKLMQWKGFIFSKKKF